MLAAANFHATSKNWLHNLHSKCVYLLRNIHFFFLSFLRTPFIHQVENAVKNSIQNLNPAVHILHKARYVKTLQRMMIYKSECWSIVTGDTRFNFDWSRTMELSPTLQLSPMFHPHPSLSNPSKLLPAGQWGRSGFGMLVILWKSSWQALQRCVRPKQKNTATEQQ